MNQKSFWILLITLHLFFMGKQLFFANSILQDSKEYLFAADNLINHNTLYSWNLNHAYNPDWLSKRPFLYPLILALFKIISFGSNGVFLFLVYLSQNLASLLSIFLCLKILQFLSIKPNWTHASIFMALSISQYIYSNMLMSETYLQLCLSAMAYMHICKPNTVKWSLFSSLTLIAGLALKPVLMPFAFVYPIFVVLKQLPKFHYKFVLQSLLPILFILLVNTWNFNRTGYRHYSSISTINLLHYNTYTMLMYQHGEKIADSIVDEIHFKGNLLGNYADKQNYIKHACNTLISDNIPTYTFLHLRGMLFCVLDPGRFDISQFFGLSHGKNLLYESNKNNAFYRIINSMLNPLGIVLGILFLFNLLKLFLMFKFIFKRSIPLMARLIVICFPLYIIFLTGPIGASRFLMPIIPLLFTIALAQKHWFRFK